MNLIVWAVVVLGSSSAGSVLPPGYTYIPADEGEETFGNISGNLISLCPEDSYLDGVSTAVNHDSDNDKVLKYLRFHCSGHPNHHLPNLEVTINNPQRYPDIYPMQLCGEKDYINAFQMVKSPQGKVIAILFYCAINNKVLGDRPDLQPDEGTRFLKPYYLPQGKKFRGFATSTIGYGIDGFVAILDDDDTQLSPAIDESVFRLGMP